MQNVNSQSRIYAKGKTMIGKKKKKMIKYKWKYLGQKSRNSCLFLFIGLFFNPLSPQIWP